MTYYYNADPYAPSIITPITVGSTVTSTPLPSCFMNNNTNDNDNNTSTESRNPAVTMSRNRHSPFGSAQNGENARNNPHQTPNWFDDDGVGKECPEQVFYNFDGPPSVSSGLSLSPANSREWWQPHQDDSSCSRTGSSPGFDQNSPPPPPPPPREQGLAAAPEYGAYCSSSYHQPRKQQRIPAVVTPTKKENIYVLSARQRNMSSELSDAIHPHKNQMKGKRKSKTVVGVTSGAIVGGVMFGPAFPVGMVLGGAVGGYASNKLSKSGERRMQRHFEQTNFQKYASEYSAVTNAVYV